VLKPLSLSASQGVVRANNREEFLAAAARVRRLLKSPDILATREANLDRMLVEGYIPGREVAVEGLLTDGALSILAIFDKPDPLEGPYFEETIYVTPSRLPNPSSAPLRNAREIRREPWDYRMDQSTRSFASTRLECGHWKSRPGRSAGSAPEPCDFLLMGQMNQSDLKSCFFRHALELPGWNSPRERIAPAS